MRILVAEDERDLNRLICRTLERAGYSVDACFDGEDALDHLLGAEYDCLLLDVIMPKKDGHEVLRAVRAKGDATPVIFLTARDSIQDRIEGLDLGADDFVAKPFNPVIFAAKARALIRRSRGLPMEDMICAGPFTYNSGTLRFYKNGEEIVLSGKENAMMKLFMDNPDRIFSRSRLYDLVWGGSLVDENTDMVYISRLRAKIEDNPSHPLYIQTVRGLGYRFTVPA